VDLVAWEEKDARDALCREEISVLSTTVAKFVLLDDRPAAGKLLIVIGLNPGRLGSNESTRKSTSSRTKRVSALCKFQRESASDGFSSWEVRRMAGG
jgi:hypothetical protein